MVVFPNSQLMRALTKLFNTIIDTLPVFYADKGYRYIDKIICTNTELQEAAFLPPFLIGTQWSNTYHVQTKTVNSNAALDAQGVCLVTSQMVKKDSRFQLNSSEAVAIGI